MKGLCHPTLNRFGAEAMHATILNWLLLSPAVFNQNVRASACGTKTFVVVCTHGCAVLPQHRENQQGELSSKEDRKDRQDICSESLLPNMVDPRRMIKVHAQPPPQENVFFFQNGKDQSLEAIPRQNQNHPTSMVCPFI